MTLPEEFAFLFLLQRALFLLSFGPLEAIMDGAAILDLDLALFNLGFLNFELGERRLRGDYGESNAAFP